MPEETGLIISFPYQSQRAKQKRIIFGFYPCHVKYTDFSPAAEWCAVQIQLHSRPLTPLALQCWQASTRCDEPLSQKVLTRHTCLSLQPLFTLCLQLYRIVLHWAKMKRLALTFHTFPLYVSKASHIGANKSKSDKYWLRLSSLFLALSTFSVHLISSRQHLRFHKTLMLFVVNLVPKAGAGFTLV